jgi:hypothetical protein
MGLLVGVPVLVDRVLNVGVAELLLDEVDGLPPRQSGRGRVSEIAKPDRDGSPASWPSRGRGDGRCAG